MNMGGVDGRYLLRIWDLFTTCILSGEIIHFVKAREGTCNMDNMTVVCALSRPYMDP